MPINLIALSLSSDWFGEPVLLAEGIIGGNGDGGIEDGVKGEFFQWVQPIGFVLLVLCFFTENAWQVIVHKFEVLVFEELDIVIGTYLPKKLTMHQISDDV